MKKSVLTALQIAVTLAVLFYVFRDPAKRADMLGALKHADAGWLLLGILTYGVVELSAGVRWQLLLRVQGIRLAWRRIFELLMIGVFFNFIIPGGTGGDVVKVFYLLKETPGRAAPALLSALVDRVVGLFALILIAGCAVALRWSWLTSSAATAQFVWIALLVLGGSACGLALSLALASFGLVHRLPARLPGRDKLAELAVAYGLYGRAWRPTLAALAISFIAHLGTFLTFYCAARALEAPATRVPSFADLCTVMPVVNTIVGLPISVGGVGVREGLFELFLGQLAGIRPAVAVVISSTGYLLTLFWGLIGALIYMSYRPSEHRRLAEMTEEVAAFEHGVAEEEIALEEKR